MAGTQIEYEKSLFFDLIRTGEIYMGMARSEPIWGFSTLAKINHPRITTTTDWPSKIMGQTGESIPTQKFWDINSLRYLPSGDIPSGSPKNVSIAYLLSTADETDIDNFTFLDSSLIGNLELEYMNEEWVRIRKLNAEYLDTILNSFSESTYDYYLFNYDQNINSRTIIQSVSTVVLPELSSPIRLMYSTTPSATVPTTAFGNNLVGNLNRNINILGEVSMTGLESTFVTTGKGYIEDNSLNNAVFFLTNAEGTIIQDNMNYINVVSTSNETSIIFSYPLVSEAVENSGRLKITVSSDPAKLAIYPEKFSKGKDATDDVPAPLLLNYLKTGMMHTSMFDILGIVQIEPERAEQITCIADINDSLNGKYFTINAADGSGGQNNYYVWYKTGAAESDPGAAGTGLKVTITTNATAAAVASATASIISSANSGLDFSTSVNSNVITVKNLNIGTVTSAADVDTIFVIAIANDISFARRIDTEATRDLLASVPLVAIEPIELITISSNPDTTVEFAITNDIVTATSYSFDLVRIIKNLDTTTPTDKVYRQMFLCYKPKVSDGTLASISSSGAPSSAPEVYTSDFTDMENGSDPIFDTTNHKYDMGILLYLVNKQPVFREHMTQNETFTILV